MDTIIYDNDTEGNGILTAKQKILICSLISRWFEKLNQSIKNSEFFEIRKLIIRPIFMYQFYKIDINIEFHFFLPYYSYHFTKENNITILRLEKRPDRKITQKDFDNILNEFLLDQIRGMKRISDKHQEAFTEMLSVL